MMQQSTAAFPPQAEDGGRDRGAVLGSVSAQNLSGSLSLEEVVRNVAKETAEAMISQELAKHKDPRIAFEKGKDEDSNQRLPSEAVLLLQGSSELANEEDMLLLKEAASAIVQLLIEEERIEASSTDLPTWSCMRWATLTMRLLADRHQRALREGKCLLSISSKVSLTLAEEQLAEYLFIKSPQWAAEFPELKQTCCQLLVARLQAVPLSMGRLQKRSPGEPLWHGLSASRRSRVVTSDMYSSRKNPEASLDLRGRPFRTMGELPALDAWDARGVAALFTHSADALPPPPGFSSESEEDETDEED